MGLRSVFAILLAATTCGATWAAPPAKVLHAQLQETQLQIIQAERRYVGYSTQKDASGKDRITKVFLGTASAYTGLKEGDVLVDEKLEEQPKGLVAHLTLQRNGQKFSVEMNAPGNFRRYLNAEATQTQPPPTSASASAAAAVKVVQALAPSPSPERESPKLAISTTETAESASPVSLQAATEKVFRGRDLVVLIDRSGSMSTSDCPGALSRWDWCKEQVVSLSEATRSIFPTGFRLGLYNNHCDISDNADVDSIVKAFTSTKPDGGTYTADAITHELRDLRERKRHGGAKPMVVIVVTDGAPNSPSALRDVLVNATNDMERADDLQVVFIQIGEDDQSTTLLEQLERHLTDAGARFPIAHNVPFEKVKETGLLRAITDALSNN
jgi:Mg-chelatase subunit ChlD